MAHFFVDTIDKDRMTVNRNMLQEHPNKISDDEIISGLVGSDLSVAVNALYDMFYRDIVDFVQIKGGGEEDGADIFQEAIVILIDEIREGKFRGESKIKTFLYGIARNLWLVEFRTRERRKKREENYMYAEPVIEEVKFPDKDSGALDILFNQIGDVCKKILIGFYYENKSMKLLLKDFDFKNEQVLRNRKNLCMKKMKNLLTSNQNLLKSLKSSYIYE
jgi:RNA polymerase sigma factor (sigma-70 family)